jgi:hypothetical protein
VARDLIWYALDGRVHAAQSIKAITSSTHAVLLLADLLLPVLLLAVLRADACSTEFQAD